MLSTGPNVVHGTSVGTVGNINMLSTGPSHGGFYVTHGSFYDPQRTLEKSPVWVTPVGNGFKSLGEPYFWNSRGEHLGLTM